MATRTYEDVTHRVQSDHLRPSETPQIVEGICMKHAEARPL
jgi:hypothetical protein